MHMAFEKVSRTTMDGEVWRDIPAMEGRFSISTYGRVYNNKSGWYLHARLNRGYLYVQIAGRTYSIHQLIANAFLGYEFGVGNEVNHIDGNKTNNRLDNLEVVSHRDNMQHAWKNGLILPENLSKRKRNPELGGVQKKLNEFVDGLSISRLEFERKTGVSCKIFNEGGPNRKLQKKTIEKIKRVYPQFEI